MVGFAVVTSLLLLASAATDAVVFMGYAAPVVGLLLPLICGRYVGERYIRRLAQAWRARRRPAPRAAPRPRSAPVQVVRGGHLIAASLAERGPPSPLVA